jgi:hypothetical protein
MMNWFATRLKSGKEEVFDPIRRKWVRLTPEEEVRQMLLRDLVENYQVPAGLISVEFPLMVNSMEKRCDAVVFDNELKPLMIVECKAAKIHLTQTVAEQISAYNLALKVPFLLVTNGNKIFFVFVDHLNHNIQFMNRLMGYSEMISFRSSHQ